MTNLPTVHDAALDYARRWITANRSLDPFRLGCSPFDPDAGHVLLRHELKTLAMLHPFYMSVVKDYARQGWHVAILALNELVAEHLAHDRKLSPQLADYVIDANSPGAPKPRGPQKAKNFLQNICIVLLIQKLLLHFGPALKATRSRLSGKNTPTACSIAAIVFSEAHIGRTLDARTVERIWDRFPHA